MRRVCLTILIVLATLVELGIAKAQSEDARYFPETGHWVSGSFLRFYDSVPDPVLTFGYPITDAFQTDTVPQYPGLLVQYFQKARFEYHPENPIELRVVLSQLGDYLYQVDGQGEAVQIAQTMSACRRIPQDGYPVCYAFLTFFDRYGGVAQFGYPISEIEWHDGSMVQYFQRARFEWHAGSSNGQRVTLTNLGKQYFLLKEPSSYLLPSQDDYAAKVLSLQAHAFVTRSVIAPNGTQVLYVIVQDQNLRAVPNAGVSVIVTLADGTESRYILPITNQFGVASISFNISGKSLGVATIDIFITSNLLSAKTRTSFRVW